MFTCFWYNFFSRDLQTRQKGIGWVIDVLAAPDDITGWGLGLFHKRSIY